MLSVLLVEDDPAKRQQVATVLLRSGVVSDAFIDAASDATTARRMLKNRAYDLLILDLAMPERIDRGIEAEAGKNLLGELCDGETMLMPKRIIGLTGFEELMEGHAEYFSAMGVLLVKYEPSTEGWQDTLTTCLRQVVAVQRADAAAVPGYDSYLGIVCVLDVELRALERLDWSWTDVEVPGDPTFYRRGVVRHRPYQGAVIAALSPRMGMSAASITASKLINHFRPSVIVAMGITAAMTSMANLGDVLVADECWDWGMGKWMVRDGERTFLSSPHHIAIDADMRVAAVRVSRDRALLRSIRDGWDAPAPDTELHVRIGPIASGAAVIASQEMSEEIRAQHRKLIGVEMEAYGVYAAAAEAVRPRPAALAIKAVSDFADEAKGDSYQAYAAYCSASIVDAMFGADGVDAVG